MSESERRLEEVIASYLEAARRGDVPSREELLKRYPDLAGQLGRFLDNEAWLRGIGAEGDATGADTQPAATPLVGDRVRYFGDYELLQEIARGSMGVVHRARQLSLNREVALKMILAGELATEEQVRRFRSEAEAAATLDHPNIVPIYEVGEHQGRHYYSMKLIEGRSLADAVPELLTQPRRVAELLARAARAVHHAHQRGVLHRDIKPTNILLDPAGDPHVTDFGLAKRAGDGRATLSGAIVGTPQYMSPEQARAQKGLTTAADVYSLGAVLYECLAGRPPFRGGAALDVLQAVITEEPAHPGRINAQASGDLSVIALKCLAKEPERRYQSAAALADDLERWLRGEPIAARPAGAAERAWRWCRRNPAVAGLGAGLALLVAAGAAVALLFAAWLVAAAVALVLTTATGLSLLLAYWALREARRANLNARRAEDLAAEAEDQRRRAERFAAEALGQRRLAEEKAAEALASGREAHRRREVTEALAYAGKVRQAQSALAARDYPLAQRLLGECEPSLRGWEHRHLRNRLERAYRPLAWHTNGVICAALSPEGSRFATGSWDRTARVWGPAAGAEVLVLRGHGSGVVGLAWSPDGRHIATASWDGTARLWCSRTGRELAALRGAEAEPNAVAWSPDGGRLAVAWSDGTLGVWDPAAGEPALRLEGHQKAAVCVAWSPCGGFLASGSGDTTVRVWEAASGTPLHTLSGHADRVTGVAWSPDGRRIASVSPVARSREEGLDRSLKVWDAERGEDLRVFQGRPSIWEGRPPGARGEPRAEIDWGGPGGRLRTRGLGPSEGFPDVGPAVRENVWDADTGEEISTRIVPRFGTLPGGRVGVAAGSDGTLFLSDTQGEASLLPGGLGFVLAWSPGLERCLVSGSDGELLIRDVATGQPISTLGLGARVSASTAAWSPDGGRIAVQVCWYEDRGGIVWGDETRTWALQIWSLRPVPEVRTVSLSGEPFRAMAWSPDGKWIACRDWEGRLGIWGAETGEPRSAFPCPVSDYGTIAWSPDGGRIAASSEGGAIAVWDVSEGRLVLRIGGAKPVSTFAWSPDGGRLVGNSGKDTTIWDSHTGEPLLVLQDPGTEGGAYRLGWSPDGQRVATVGFFPDGQVATIGVSWKLRLWDPKTGTLVFEYPDASSFAWSSDGCRLVVSGSSSGGHIDRILDSGPADLLGECLGVRRPPI